MISGSRLREVEHSAEAGAEKETIRGAPKQHSHWATKVIVECGAEKVSDGVCHEEYR